MIHYYNIGGKNMESHVEIHRLLPYLKKEKLENSYQLLLAGFLKHADSIVTRRCNSSSPEVSCANGMMSIKGVILIVVFSGHLLTTP